jgi:glycosyltransferase involved in cell wall biosynthesis
MTDRRPLLMVTPYAPYRDGIAAYAVQEVRRLRSEGVDVEVLSPLPSAAHHHLALGGVRGVLALTKRAADYESVVIQFSPEMLFGACRHPAQRVAVWGGLLAVATRTDLEIRLHEIEYGPLEHNPAERTMATRVLRAADRVTVHTRREVEELRTRLGIEPGAITLVDHGAHFATATDLSPAEARAELGLPSDEHVFLAIGFIQEHKGFDLAVDAFGRAGLERASFHLVGSVRIDHPDLLAYARQLAGQCRATPGVSLHQRYVSDEEFDRWIVAADTVVLPYREIWSSGVLERAKLHATPVIAADVGGIGDQAPPGTLFFTDVESLAKVFAERVAADLSSAGGGSSEPADEAGAVIAPDPGWDIDRDTPDRASVERQIRARARERQLGDDSVDGIDGAAVDRLLAIGPLHRPHAVSARPGVTEVKRTLRRLVNWEIEPIADQVEALRLATTEAVAELERRFPTPAGAAGTDPDAASGGDGGREGGSSTEEAPAGKGRGGRSAKKAPAGRATEKGRGGRSAKKAPAGRAAGKGRGGRSAKKAPAGRAAEKGRGGQTGEEAPTRGAGADRIDDGAAPSAGSDQGPDQV